jgi:hypothetical protein
MRIEIGTMATISAAEISGSQSSRATVDPFACALSAVPSGRSKIANCAQRVADQ